MVKAAKKYSINQETLDYSLEKIFSLVIQLGSDTLIKKIASQLKERLAAAELVAKNKRNCNFSSQNG